jgi:hypothetical protein
MKYTTPSLATLSSRLLMCSTLFGSMAQACTVPDLSSKPKVSQWLDASEAASGHALSCHTGKTSNQLIGRIENRGGSQGDDCRPYPDQSSSFTTKELLRDLIFDNRVAALASMRAATPGGGGGNVVGDYAGDGTTIGTVVRLAEKKEKPLCSDSRYVCKPAVKATLVFADVGGACVLRTAYPVAK